MKLLFQKKKSQSELFISAIRHLFLLLKRRNYFLADEEILMRDEVVVELNGD